MDKVIIDITGDVGTKASETISDLRNATETLYFPMKVVGFWDERASMHLCPQEERRQTCPHTYSDDDPRYVNYASTLQRQRQASLEVMFPHAAIKLYLS